MFRESMRNQRSSSSVPRLLLEPVVIANLFLRFLAIGVALYFSRWYGGDTGDFLNGSNLVCAGEWGGLSHRPPIYYWFLCLFSPLISLQASSIQVALPLILQTLLVWLAGVFFLRWQRTELFLGKRCSRLLAICWFFDPVLFIFSNTIMSDALFCVCMLFLAISFWRFFRTTNSLKNAIVLAIAIAVVSLQRSVGVFVSGWLLILLFAHALLNKPKLLKKTFFILALALFLAFPRIYWNGTRHHAWTISAQGSGWLQAVAAVVKYEGTGLDFRTAESRWYSEYPQADRSFVLKTLRENLRTFTWLSMKGTLRVLFGHVNVEWVHFITGVSPVGPGWFKVPENREAVKVSDFGSRGVVFWVLGVLSTGLFSLWVYCRAFQAVRKAKRFDLFSFWALTSVGLLAFIPLVFGDARFRLGLWPLVLVLWADGLHRATPKRKAS